MRYLSIVTVIDDHSLLSGDLENYIGYGVIISMLLLFLIVMLVLLRTFKVLTRIVLRSQGRSLEQVTFAKAVV